MTGSLEGPPLQLGQPYERPGNPSDNIFFQLLLFPLEDFAIPDDDDINTLNAGSLTVTADSLATFEFNFNGTGAQDTTFAGDVELFLP